MVVTRLEAYLDRQVERRPEAPAISHPSGRTIDFGMLGAASDRLAALLVEAGLAGGDRVAFLMPKSIEAIVAMVGVLKAGGAYVPLDAAGPAPRLARILDRCQPAWVLAAGPVGAMLADALAARERQDPVRIGWLAGDPPAAGVTPAFGPADLAAHPARRIRGRGTADGLAHILFTSGSTGTPKGVMIAHRNVVPFIDWAVDHFGMGPDDRVSGHSPLHFDLSTFDVYGAIAAGAHLHLVPPELNLLAPRLAELIRTAELTQWFSVPSALVYLDRFDAIRQDDFPSLRRLLWCGEVFPTAPLRRIMARLPHVTFTNLYGPTEATIASSHHTLPAAPESDLDDVPIGIACPGEQLLVLDEHRQAVPAGVVGDLHIAGVGLSPGYWQDPEATERAYGDLPAAPGGRSYRTGDLAHVDATGLVHFHGRADSQVKSRGHRIELGEIETALSTVSGLQQAAVVGIPTSGFEGTVIACAYVPRPDVAIDPASIRRALAGAVPAYMLPSRWLRLDRLPLNANGKVDRPALRAAMADVP